MQAKLLVSAGKATTSEIVLKLPAVVGRAKEAGVRIVHPSVSRRHCEIYELDGALVIRDLGSTNGTYLGTERVEEAVVKPGDELTIGPLTFRAAYTHNGAFPVLGGKKETAQLKTRKATDTVDKKASDKKKVDKKDESKAPAAKSKTQEAKAPAKPPEKPKAAPKVESAIEETLFFDADADAGVEADPIEGLFDDSPAAPAQGEAMDDFFASLGSDSPEVADEAVSPPEPSEESEAVAWDDIGRTIEQPEEPAIFDSVAGKETISEVPQFNYDDAQQEPIASSPPAAEEDAFAAWLSDAPETADAKAAEAEAAPEALNLGEEVEELSFDEVAEAAAAPEEPVAEEDPFATWLSESQPEAAVEPEAIAEPEPEVVAESEIAAEPELMQTIDHVDELSFDELVEAAPDEEPIAETPAPAEPVAEDDAFAAWLNEPPASSEPEEVEAFQPLAETQEVEALSFEDVSEAPPEAPPEIAEPVEAEPVAEDDAFAAWLNDDEPSPAEPEPIAEVESAQTIDDVEALSFDELVESASEEPISELPGAEFTDHAEVNEAEALVFDDIVETPDAEAPAAEASKSEQPATIEPVDDEDAFAAWLGEPEAQPSTSNEAPAEAAFAPIDEALIEESAIEEEPVAADPFNFLADAAPEPEKAEAISFDLKSDLAEAAAESEIEDAIVDDELLFAAEADLSMPDDGALPESEEEQAEGVAWDFVTEGTPPETVPAAPELLSSPEISQSDETSSEDAAIPELELSSDDDDMFAELGLSTEGAPDTAPAPLDTSVEEELSFDALMEDEAGEPPVLEFADAESEPDETLWAPEPQWGEPAAEVISDNEESLASPHDGGEFSLANGESFTNGESVADHETPATNDVDSEPMGAFGFADEASTAGLSETIAFDPDNPFASQADISSPVETAEANGGFDLAPPPMTAMPVARAPEPSPVAEEPKKRGWWPFGRKSREEPKPREPEPAESAVNVRRPLPAIPVEPEIADIETPSVAPHFMASTAMNVAASSIAAASVAATTSINKRRVNIAAGPSGELDTLDVMFPPIETVPPVQPVSEVETPENAGIEDVESTSNVESAVGLVADQLFVEAAPAIEFAEESAPEAPDDELMFLDEPSDSEAEAVASPEAPVVTPSFDAASFEDAPSSDAEKLDATVMWDDESVPVLDFDEVVESPVETNAAEAFAPPADVEMTFDESMFAEPTADEPVIEESAADAEIANVLDFVEPESVASEEVNVEFTNEVALNGSQEPDDDFLSFLDDTDTPVEEAASMPEDGLMFSEEPPAGDAEFPTPEASQSDKSEDDGLSDFLRDLGK
jgi:hypothetical protein